MHSDAAFTIVATQSYKTTKARLTSHIAAASVKVLLKPHCINEKARVKRRREMVSTTGNCFFFHLQKEADIVGREREWEWKW